MKLGPVVQEIRLNNKRALGPWVAHLRMTDQFSQEPFVKYW